jgi:hypothetical protein
MYSLAKYGPAACLWRVDAPAWPNTLWLHATVVLWLKLPLRCCPCAGHRQHVHLDAVPCRAGKQQQLINAGLLTELNACAA